MVSKDNKILFRSLLAALIIGLGVNIGFALFMDFTDIRNSLGKVDFWVLFVPFACYFLIYLIDSARIGLVLRQFGVRIGFREAFYNSVATNLFSNLTPFASGGQPYQIYHLVSLGIDTRKATNIVLSRYVEFMFTALVIFLLGIPTALRLAGTMSVGKEPFFVGFAVTLIVSIFFILALVRPDLIGRLLLRVRHGFLGGALGKISGNRDWAEEFHRWSMMLKEETAFLWTEKLPVMMADVTLGLINLVLQAASLTYVLIRLTPLSGSAADILVAFVIINLVVYYVPTPGASGSVEGAYIWVFSGMTGVPGMTAVAVLVWRVATYYFHILFGLVVFILRTSLRTTVRRKGT